MTNLVMMIAFIIVCGQSKKTLAGKKIRGKTFQKKIVQALNDCEWHATQFFCQHDPTSNLAESRYPRNLFFFFFEIRLPVTEGYRRFPIVGASSLARSRLLRKPQDRNAPPITVK